MHRPALCIRVGHPISVSAHLPRRRCPSTASRTRDHRKLTSRLKPGCRLSDAREASGSRRISVEKWTRIACSAASETEAEEKEAKEEHPWKDWVTFEADYKEGACPPAAARRIIGMGTWLTRGMLAPPFEFCVSEIEGLWRQILDDRGFALKKVKQRYQMVDSMDPNGRKGERFTRESENPKPRDADYPRMILENRMYQSQKFGKLHIGVGIRQDGIQFVHCQMIPRPIYDMPIYTINLVGMECISLAYVDLVTVSKDELLPDFYIEGMRLLQRDTIASNRPSPSWSSRIASPFMTSLSPKNDQDALNFLAYAGLLSKVYMKSADLVSSVTSTKRIKEIKEAHAMFLTESLKHEQLQVAMSKSFKDDWIREYFRDCFFPVEHD